MTSRLDDGYPEWVAVVFHISLALPTGLSVMTWNDTLIEHLADAGGGESLFVFAFYAVAMLAPLIIGTLSPTALTRTISVLTQVALGRNGLVLPPNAPTTTAALRRTSRRLHEASALQLIVLAILGVGASRSASLLPRHSHRPHTEEETDEPDRTTQ